jgi:hypothetical protein
MAEHQRLMHALTCGSIFSKRAFFNLSNRLSQINLWSFIILQKKTLTRISFILIYAFFYIYNRGLSVKF